MSRWIIDYLHLLPTVNAIYDPKCSLLLQSGSQYELCLGLATRIYYKIVGIALEVYSWNVLSHTPVKPQVQMHIRQQWTNDYTLMYFFTRWNSLSIIFYKCLTALLAVQLPSLQQHVNVHLPWTTTYSFLPGTHLSFIQKFRILAFSKLPHHPLKHS